MKSGLQLRELFGSVETDTSAALDRLLKLIKLTGIAYRTGHVTVAIKQFRFNIEIVEYRHESFEKGARTIHHDSCLGKFRNRKRGSCRIAVRPAGDGETSTPLRHSEFFFLLMFIFSFYRKYIMDGTNLKFNQKIVPIPESYKIFYLEQFFDRSLTLFPSGGLQYQMRMNRLFRCLKTANSGI